MNNVFATTVNVLIEKIDKHTVTTHGIVMPDNVSNTLNCGIVIKKGPGFLIPFPTEHRNEIDTLIDEHQPKFIPLDISEGDTVYYSKNAEEQIYINGQSFVIVPYLAIKLFQRNFH